jgi:hypothetical protein
MLPEGNLADFSGCTEDILQTKKLTGTIKLKSDKCLKPSDAKGALAKAFEFSEKQGTYIYPTVVCDGTTMTDDRRRLGAHATKENTISYTVYVPEGVEHTDLVDKIKEINDGGAAQALFVDHLKDEAGIDVDASSIEAPAPTVSSVVITTKADGSMGATPVPLKDLIPAAAAPAPPASEEEGGNVGAIVGGIIGALVGVALIGGVAYYFLVVKKRSES